MDVVTSSFLEDSSSSDKIERVKPTFKENSVYEEFIDITCGTVCGERYINNLSQKGNKLPKCILCCGKWYTPTEFEGIAGKSRSSKRRSSIQHNNIPLSSFLPTGQLSDIFKVKDGEPLTGGVPFMPLSQESSLSHETLQSSIGNNISTTLMDKIEKTLLSSIQIAIEEAITSIRKYVDEEINKVSLLVRDVKKQVEILMSTHTTHSSSNDVPPEVKEDLVFINLIYHEAGVI